MNNDFEAAMRRRLAEVQRAAELEEADPPPPADPLDYQPTVWDYEDLYYG